MMMTVIFDKLSIAGVAGAIIHLSMEENDMYRKPLKYFIAFVVR